LERSVYSKPLREALFSFFFPSKHAYFDSGFDNFFYLHVLIKKEIHKKLIRTEIQRKTASVARTKKKTSKGVAGYIVRTRYILEQAVTVM